MTFEEFETLFCLSSATLLSVTINGPTIDLVAELATAIQYDPKLREREGDVFGARIRIQTDGISQRTREFTGFVGNQDGEVSHFGPSVSDDAVAAFELAFFVCDYDQPPGGHDFVVMEFDIKDIMIEIEQPTWKA